MKKFLFPFFYIDFESVIHCGDLSSGTLIRKEKIELLLGRKTFTADRPFRNYEKYIISNELICHFCIRMISDLSKR